MPRIRCHYNDCTFIDDIYCSAAAVEMDPKNGCITFLPADGVPVESSRKDNDEFDEDELEEEEDAEWGDDDVDDDDDEEDEKDEQAY